MARILVVEDSHAQAVALRQILQSEGLAVELAPDGEKGLARLQTDRFDLVLSDILMPGMSGFELCKAIKSDPRTAATPVILLTALRDAADILRGLECGADNFITKPFEEKYLLGRIRAILSGTNTGAPAGDSAETLFRGQRFVINAGKQRVLDYLLSTYEDFARAKDREHQSRLAEVTLRESLRFLQSTLDALSAQIAILDDRGEIIAVNSAWRQLAAPNPLAGAQHGVGVDYLQVCDATAAEGSGAAAQIAAGIRAVIASQRADFVLEYPARGADEEHWYLARVTRFAGEGPIHIVVAHADITARKRAEAAFRESQRALSTLLANLPGMAYRCHLDPEWTIRFANEGCTELTGYQPRDLVNSATVAYTKLIHPDDRDRVAYARRAAIRSNMPLRLVYRITTADGREKWVWEQGRGVQSAGGRLVALEGIIVDITKRKFAEVASATEAQISNALACVGRELISSVNTPELLDRLCELTAEVVGCDASHMWLLQADGNAPAWVPVSSYGDTKEQWESIQLVRVPGPVLAGHVERLDGEEVFQEISGESHDQPLLRLAAQTGTAATLYVAVRRGAQVIGFLTAEHRRHGGFTVVQERVAHGMAHLASMALETARLVEELERANRFKSDFLAAMSHELRTPLNVIIGYNALLLEEAFGPINESQSDTSRRIDKNARELLELVSATLDLTRFDSKRVPLHIDDIDVGAFMAEVERETAPMFPGAAVQARWFVGADLPPLHSDHLKLRMVLKNLIGNAIKFTEQGAVQVSAQRLDGGIEFRVSDTGIGIPPAARALIFEPFQQANSSIGQRYGGAGLGLYLVRRILEMLGGRIALESEVGKGSTFRVWLPTGVGEAADTDSPAPPNA